MAPLSQELEPPANPGRFMCMAGTSLQTLTATAAAFLFGCAAASATTVQLCNATKDAVEVAIGFGEKGVPFETKGWWVAQAGKCSEPIPRGRTGIYFLHIKKVAGGSVAFGTGNKFAMVCASQSNFTDRPRDHRNDGKLDCSAGGLMTLKFIKFEMSRADLPDVLTLEPNGAIKVSNSAADQPKAEERKAPSPSPPKAPSATPPPNKSQTPDACKRYPNLC